MKNLYIITFILFIISGFTACNNSTSVKQSAEKSTDACCSQAEKSCCDKTQTVASNETKVLYFHNERRCATCMAVEEKSKEAIASLKEKVAFKSLQIGTEESKLLEEKFKIAGQTLLVIKDGKITDLTNVAFLNARVNPEVYTKELVAILN